MTTVIDTLMRAMAHQGAGRFAAAAELYADLLARQPGHPDASFHYGLLLLRQDRFAAAAAQLKKAHAARPDDVRIRQHLGRALIAAEDTAAALSVLTGGPDLAEIAFLRGTALNALGDPAAAERALRHAVSLDPAHAQAHLNLGNALADLDRLAEAEAYIRTALALAPNLAEAHASLGFVLTALGRLAEAVDACDRAISLRPDFARAHWNKGIACLLAGDYARGWDGYEWRFRNDPAWRGPRLPGPVWDGAPLAGRTLLVLAEQGLGDTIQFARYLPLIAGRVVLACDSRLVTLLAELPGLAAIVPTDRPLPPHDVWVDQMSLPRLFLLRPDSLPSPDGYLLPRWTRPAPHPRPRVGLVWAGNPAHHNDRRRSLPRACLAALRGVPVEWVSLQVGPRAAEAADLGMPDTSAALTDFAATARVIPSLDLVLTIDSAVAHLAGAMGCPTWIMLPHAPDWRWMLGTSGTPWYSSVELLRQPSAGDWESVLKQVRAAVIALTPNYLTHPNWPGPRLDKGADPRLFAQESRLGYSDPGG